jgi:predicted transcriptional regulator
MRNNKVNRLAVLDNSRFVGLVTNYDIVQKFTKVEDRLPMNSRVYRLSNVPVSDIMERNPKVIDHERALSEAVRVLVENGISSILVFKNDKPVGMLTVMDVLESVIAKRNIEERKVFISGLDADSFQYNDDIREELKSFIDHAEKLSGISIDYVTLRVKRVGNKSYEIQVRLSLGNKGIISLHTTTPSFQESFRNTMARLKERLMKEKGKMLTVRKVNLYRDAEAVS